MAEDDNYKILIVEDDEDLREMLSGYFHVQGYDILRAHWGQEAIDLAHEHRPDLILEDIRLPDIDGFEVVRRLRASRITKNIPVIFLTDRRSKKDKLAGLELGAVDYVTKPFDIQELRLRVQNVIQRIESDQYFNPITNMPDGLLLRDQLESMLKEKNWGLVAAGVKGIERFRDQYGFVAADEVTRSVSVLLSGACKKDKHQEPFVGQLGPAEFLIITTDDQTAKIAQDCQKCLEPAIDMFYPMQAQEDLSNPTHKERLAPTVTQISSSTGIRTYHELRQYFNRLSV
ncbi:MAG: response regulator [Chloroflexota bacterium]